MGKLDKVGGWTLFLVVSLFTLFAGIWHFQTHKYMNGVVFVEVGMMQYNADGDTVYFPVYRRVSK